MIVARQTILFRHVLNSVDPSLVDGRADGEGRVTGFFGRGNLDFLVVRVGTNVGVYVEEEVSAVDAAPDVVDYDRIPQGALDSAVDQAVSEMGSSINNDGRSSQIAFLKERGWSTADFGAMIKKPKPKKK